MSLIVNPGSGPVPVDGDGWRNTFAAARAEALRWRDQMERDGLRDIDMTEPEPDDIGDDGRWTFEFRHRVTGVTVTLATHGVDNDEAYTNDGHIFGAPRIYWRGDSSAEPQLTDWASDGFEPVQTFREAS